MKTVSKIFLTIFFSLVTFLLGLFFAGIMLEDKITATAIDEINKQLKVGIKVKEVKVSLISGFPKASVRLKHVKIAGSIEVPSGLETGLLSMEEITIRFGLLGIFKNEYIIEELILKQGWLNLYMDSNGKGNFEIIDEGGSGKTTWELDLDLLKLDNVNLSYIDLQTGWVFKSFVEDAVLKGNFTAEQMHLALKGKGAVGSLKQGNFYYIRNEKVAINTTMHITDSAIDIKRSDATLGDTRVGLEGNIGLVDSTLVYINVWGKDLGVETLLSLLSQYNVTMPSGAKSKGKIAFNLNVSGLVGVESPFVVNLDFGSDRFDLNLRNKPLLTLKNIRGKFTNGDSGTPETSEVTLTSMRLESGNSAINGTLRLKNIESPIYQLKTESVISIRDVLAWGIDIPVTSGDFSGKFEALGILDGLDNISLSSFENSKFHANITAKDICLKKVGGIPDIQKISGSFNLVNQDITSASIKGLLHGSAFSAEIQAKNATAIVFGKNKTTVNTSITIDSLNTRWLLVDDSTDEKSDNGDSTWDRIRFISGDIFIDNFYHNKFKSQPLSANFYLKDNQLICNSFLSRSCGGMFTGRVNAEEKTDGYYQITADVDIDGVNVTQLFESFDNFDQDIISSSNVSGRLDGTLALSMPIINGEVDENGINALANLKLTDGRLSNVMQLESLSRFISLEDLKDIKFSKLENSIRVSNRTVVIPQMDINSSALNLSMSGTHTFDNVFQYRFQVLLSDVLYSKASRNKPENNSFGEVERDGSGRTKLYLILEGNADDFNVSYDRSTAREAFKQNLRQERESLKNMMREEFKFFRKSAQTDSLEVENANQTQTEDKSKDTKPKPKFTIEWDDE